MSVSMGMAVMMTLAMVSVAQAQPPTPSRYLQVVGDYSTDLRLSKDGKTIMADVRVRSRGRCVADLDGRVPTKLVGRTLVIEKEGPDNRTCVLQIGFNKDYTRANIRENRCSGWHGVSCQFGASGLRRQSK
jgi:hypothetical protein